MIDLHMPLPSRNFVIFGATGNLAPDTLLPSLDRSELAGKLPENLNFAAFGRREWDATTRRNHMRELLVQRVPPRGAPAESLHRRLQALPAMPQVTAQESGLLPVMQYVGGLIDSEGR